jgi:hypothetical protein
MKGNKTKNEWFSPIDSGLKSLNMLQEALRPNLFVYRDTGLKGN